METKLFEDFYVLGISTRTSNEDGRAREDIGALWQRFFVEGIAEKVNNKLEYSIYSLYTDYESDYTGDYTVILGYKVPAETTVPEGMVFKKVKGGKYTKFVAKGDLSKGVLYKEWAKIWQIDLERTYDTDFEVYGEKAKDPSNSEVEIYVEFE